MKVFCCVDKGPGKSACDDRVLINDSVISSDFYEAELDVSQRNVFAVADGVGGNKAGYYAASMAVFAMSKTNLPAELSVRCIEQRIRESNQEIIALSERNSKYRNMATTLSGICVDDGKWFLFHIGNTRVYLITYGSMNPITEDHTWAREMELNGFSEEKLAKSARKSEITACLGGGNIQLIDKLQISDITPYMQKVRSILVTSDGLHDYIDRTTLERSVANISDPKEYFIQAIRFARSEGSQDDISVVLIDL
ncbi:MAG: serine/threonine-protein phosphatase [Clostridiales bacterium]|nr:serine/threonine-protein phosphatase [Clostridiales bacterium]